MQCCFLIFIGWRLCAPKTNEKEERKEERQEGQEEEGEEEDEEEVQLGHPQLYISRFSAAKAGGAYRKRSPSRTHSRSRTPPRSRKVM
jgi:hypothetical protein